VPDLQEDRKALNRLCDRLRSAPETRLVRVEDRLSGASVADAVHGAAAWAASAQGISDQVPRLHPLASGDQLRVVGSDLLDWVAGTPTDGTEDVLAEWRALIERLRVVV
jgi:hypothetical protein